MLDIGHSDFDFRFDVAMARRLGSSLCLRGGIFSAALRAVFIRSRVLISVSLFLLGDFAMANAVPRPVDQIKGTVWIDYRTDVPGWLAIEIGRIAVEWSRLEAHFEELIRLLVQVEIHYGRMLTTGMTLRSRIATATNLAEGHVLYGTLKPTLRDQIIKFGKEIVGNLDGERNKLVHGLWGRLDGEWTLVKMSGTRILEPVGKMPRPVLPQKETITKGKAEEVRERIRNLNGRMALFCEKLEGELPPSPHKSRRQLRQIYPSRARRKKAQ